MAVKPIPEGYHTVTPYFNVTGAAQLLDFLKQAFDATETFRSMRDDGKLGHAEARIGDSMIMLSEARDQWKPMPSTIYLYVPDTDATYKRALMAGAKSIMEPVDQFYGDRNAGVEDPCGNQWWIATHIKDVTSEEIEKHPTATAASTN